MDYHAPTFAEGHAAPIWGHKAIPTDKIIGESRVRTKSIRDIRHQINRIYGNTTNPRFRERADRAYYRYIGNIQRTQTYRNDLNRASSATSMREISQRDREMLNRQYSRNQYMGLNNG